MNGYISFFGSKTFESHADTLYAAHVQALAHFKPSKSKAHLVSTHLAEKDGTTVTHVADF